MEENSPQLDSPKKTRFLSESLGNKEVVEIPGIDMKSSEKLISNGYDKASVVIGQFLILRKDKELFTDWLYQTCQLSYVQQMECYQSLVEWCKLFIGQ